MMLFIEQAKKRLLKVVDKIVEARKTAMADNGEKVPPNDAIDVLLRDSGDSDGIPLDFISGNIIEMMIPGEETVPTAMTLAVTFLVDNPVALAHMVVRVYTLIRYQDLTFDNKFKHI